MNKKLSLTLKIIAAAIILAAIAALCIWLIPLVSSLSDPEAQANFKGFIESLGVWGVLAMLLLQVLQIIVAIIPGEPIEILMGVMYGTFGGLALTLIGIAIGQTAVFFAVKKLGVKFAARFVDTKKFNELSFLNTPEKRDSLIFLLFFIPGTPKDVLTYFVPFTTVPFARFIILSTLARIPSVISSTWAGASISDGNIFKTVLIFAVTGVTGIAGIIINNRITAKKQKSKDSQ